jgi:hypothetical protein
MATNNLQNAADYKTFHSSVLSVTNVDRAGAAADDVIRSLIDQMKAKWGTVYKSQPINWRIWASRIARQPAPEHPRLIADGPPFELIHLFEHSPVQPVPVLEHVRQDNSTALTVLADMKEQLQRLEDFTARQFESFRQAVSVQLRAFHENIDRHICVAEALHAGLQPMERPDNLARLQGIPNQPDVDHQ